MVSADSIELTETSVLRNPLLRGGCLVFLSPSRMGVDEEAVVKFVVAENPSGRQVWKIDQSHAIFSH